MPHLSGTVIESQPDWLTVSVHGEQAAARMLEWATAIAAEEAEKGNRKRPWRMMGYEGYHVGAIEYGQRDQASCEARLIGDAASRYLTQAMSLADNVTRLDLAVTWRAEPPDPYLGRNAYSLAVAHWQENHHRAKPWRVEDADDGYTLYIGKRDSENFFRLYNKEAESIASRDRVQAERYAGCWRHELETKGPLAFRLAERVNDEEDRAAYVQGYIWQYLLAHGIEPAFPDQGGRALLPGFRRRSDADSKLKHLERNVAPSIRWLIDQGHEDDVRRILGLTRE